MRGSRPVGATLLEALVASGVLLMLSFMLLATLRAGTDTVTHGSVRADLNGQARNVLDEIARDLRSSAASTFSPSSPQDSPTLQLRCNERFSRDGPVFGSPITYALVPETVQTRDTHMNEWRIVRTDANAPRVLAAGASLGGLAFTWESGNCIRVRVVLERRDEKGLPVTCARETTVQMRN